MEYVDILGASAATLSLIFEILAGQQPSKKYVIRLIKNTQHVLEYPFDIPEVHYEILEDVNVENLHHNLFLGVYKPDTKRQVYQYFQKKYNFQDGQFINCIHSNAAIAETVSLGNGIQINPMSTVAPYAQLGSFVSINRQVSIGHHTVIDDFCTINPGVHIAGHCLIGEGVTVGMGALVLDGKKIGKNSIVAAGALVTKDVPDNVIVMGSPAKIVKNI